MHPQLQGQLFDRPSRLGQKTKPPKYQPNQKGQTSTIAVPFFMWLAVLVLPYELVQGASISALPPFFGW